MIWNTNSNLQVTLRPTFIHHDSNTANTVPTCVCLSGCSTHTLILGILDEKCHLSEGCHKFYLIGRKCTTPNAANNCGHENQLALTWKRWMSKHSWWVWLHVRWRGCGRGGTHSSVVCLCLNSVVMPQMSTGQTGAPDILKPNKQNKIKQISPNCQSKGERPREDNWILKGRLSAAIYFCLSRSISFIPIINTSAMVPVCFFF